jgi:hypothetical protein
MMAGSSQDPVVAYNASGYGGNGSLEINCTTMGVDNLRGTSSSANDTYFNSTVGFSILTNATEGSGDYYNANMTLIARTNTWVGDIFMMMPGFDSNATTEVGAFGSANAKSGVTIWGPSNDTRSVYLFMNEQAVEPVFGRGVQLSDLSGFQDDFDTPDSLEVNSSAQNMNVNGCSVKFDMTFASPRSGSLGVSDETNSSFGGDEQTVSRPVNYVPADIKQTVLSGKQVLTNNEIDLGVPIKMGNSTVIGSNSNNTILGDINSLVNELNGTNATNWIKGNANYTSKLNNSNFDVLYSPPAGVYNATKSKALLSWEFNGTLFDRRISDIAVYKFFPSSLGDAVQEYNIRTTDSDVTGADGDMWFTTKADQDFVLSASKMLDASDTFIMWAVVKDDGPYDLDNQTAGLIIDPPTVSPSKTSSSSSSSGCVMNPGAQLNWELLLLAIIPLMLFMRRKRQV